MDTAVSQRQAEMAEMDDPKAGVDETEASIVAMSEHCLLGPSSLHVP